MSVRYPIKAERLLRAALALSACLAGLAACGGPAQPASPAPTLTAIESQGKTVFGMHCAACHATVPETVILGPSLAGIGVRAGERVPGVDAEGYIRSSILVPSEFIVEGYAEAMPPDFGKQLTGEEFDAVVAYLLTLK